jgi:hypothetical protein
LLVKGSNRDQFETLVRLACGLPAKIPADFASLLQLAALAHRYRLEISSAIEDELLHRHLNTEICCELLDKAQQYGLSSATAAAWSMALESFEAVSATDSFLALPEDTIGHLIDDDNLQVSSEDVVFRAVARWMRGAGCEGAGQLRGKALLEKVRFGLMPPEYLAGEAHGVLPEVDEMEEALQQAYSVALNPFQACAGRPGWFDSAVRARRNGARCPCDGQHSLVPTLSHPRVPASRVPAFSRSCISAFLFPAFPCSRARVRSNAAPCSAARRGAARRGAS